MRNLKRALSLALASVMLLGMMVVGTGAFEDVTESHNEEAIAVMELAGIMIGDDKGNFNPDQKVTRNQMAVVMANMLGLDVEDYAGIAPFTDVPAWAEAYVSACYAKGIVSGTSATTYTGDAEVKAVDAGLMVMKALGYFQHEVDFGTDYKVATISQASKLDLFDDIKAKTNDALTRNEVAQLCFTALNKVIVDDVNAGLAVNDKGDLYNTYNYVPAGEELYIELFDGALYMDTETTTDDLGRPVVTWVYAEEGEDEVTATVTKSAELVYANTADADAVEKDLKAAKLAKDAEDEVAAAIEEAAVPGTTVYVYEVDDVVRIVPVAKEYTFVAVSGITEDKVSTKDEDERAVEFDNGFVVVADDEVTAGAEIDNFDKIFALEEEDAVIVIVAGEDEDGYIYSAEIPEIVEAKITRVKDTTVTAGGKTYFWAAETEAAITTEAVELVVLDGVVYFCGDIETDASEIVYVNKVFEPETDRWGKMTQTAQIVNEKFEIVEVALDNGEDNDTEVTTEPGFYTYETNDDGEYSFIDLTEENALTDVSAVEEKTAIRVDGLYFADGVKYVYIADATTADLAVTVKEGVQKNAAGAAVLNDDGDVAIVYVMAAYDDGASDDVVYIADATPNASDVDLKGDAATEYKVYVNGEEKFWLIDETVAEGFWTYEQDEETGVYSLVAEKGYNDVAVVADETIQKDKYVFAEGIEEATVKAIYDLTDEGLTTLKKIAAWDEELTISFIYDEDAEVITVLYVEAVADAE